MDKYITFKRVCNVGDVNVNGCKYDEESYRNALNKENIKNALENHTLYLYMETQYPYDNSTLYPYKVGCLTDKNSVKLGSIIKIEDDSITVRMDTTCNQLAIDFFEILKTGKLNVDQFKVGMSYLANIKNCGDYKSAEMLNIEFFYLYPDDKAKEVLRYDWIRWNAEQV